VTFRGTHLESREFAFRRALTARTSATKRDHELSRVIDTSTSSLAISSGELTLDAGGDVDLPDGIDARHDFGPTGDSRQWREGGECVLARRKFRYARHGFDIQGKHSGVGIDYGDDRSRREGRLLARTAAVTLDTNTLTLPLP
jgi:hypothetical protein